MNEIIQKSHNSVILIFAAKLICKNVKLFNFGVQIGMDELMERGRKNSFFPQFKEMRKNILMDKRTLILNVKIYNYFLKFASLVLLLGIGIFFFF